MRYKALLSMLVLGLMLAGCNNQTKKDMEQELGNLAGDQLERLEQDEPAPEIQGENSETEDVRQIRMKAAGKNAVVHISSIGYETAKVYSASQKMFSKITLMQMAEALLDKESIKVRKPYQLCDPDDIDEELRELKEQIQDHSGVVLSAQRKIEAEDGIVVSVAVEYVWDSTGATDENEIETKFTGEFRPQDVITKIGVDLPDYHRSMDAARISGTRDGIPYELNFSHEDGTLITFTRRTAKTVPTNLYRIDNDKIQGGLGENLVSLSEARSQAEEIMQELGFGDFVEKDAAIRSAHAVGKVDGVDVLDGYRFVYVRPIGHVEPVINSYTTVSTEDGSKDSTVEYATIEVDSDGVFSVSLSGLYDKGACLAEDVSLLSIDQILDIAASEQVQPLDPSVTPLNLKLEFSYVPIRNDNSFAYMPVWILSESEESWMYTGMLRYDNPLVIINAVDGSVYHYEQMTLELRDAMYSVLPTDSIE